jgi:hypothetical protein
MGRICSTNWGKWNTYRILVGKPEGNRSLEDQDIGGWIIPKWILDMMGWYGLDRTGPE